MDRKLENRVNLSGWATKDFSIEELRNYLYKYKPGIFEISKDFIDNSSIKDTYKLLKEYRKSNPLKLSYAGTTDFVNSSGISFNEYLKYLKIQSAQATFLGSDFFRILVGENKDSKEDILFRLGEFEQVAYPSRILIEIHGGWESSLENINRIIKDTDYNFVIDFQNLLKSGLSFDKLKEFIPKERIAYYHSRNLQPKYIESPEIIQEQEKWNPQKENLLWEPKLIKKQKILELIK